MKMLLNLSLLVTTVLSVSACNDFDIMGSKGKFYYSNPTAATISFQIDGDIFQVQPNQGGTLSLKTGPHTMRDSQGKQTDFMVFEHNSGGILNPNQLAYYSLSERYVMAGADNNKVEYGQTALNHHLAKVSIKRTNLSIIDGNLFRCSYLVDEDTSELINSNDADNDVTLKCFDQPKLIQYFKTEYNEVLKEESLKNESLGIITVNYNYDIPESHFVDPKMQFIAQQLNELIVEVKESNNSDVHTELNKKYHQLVIELADSQLNSPENNKIESIKYNEFVSKINQLKHHGIWMK